MQLLKGLQTDSLPRNQQPGSWRDGSNLVVTSHLGSLSSEPGFDSLYPVGITPIGKHSLGEGRTVVFSVGAVPEIGILDKTGYTTLIRDNALGFHKDYPVLFAEHQLTIRGELILAWTDNHNPPRLLNLTTPGFALRPDKSLVNPDAFVTAQLFAPGLAPVIDLVDVVNGGQLLTGVYSYAVCYEDESGFTTKWLPTSSPVQVIDYSLASYKDTDGAPGGTPTNKSVRLRLSGLDTRYAYVRVASISRINEVVTATQIQRVKLLSSLTILHTGTETPTSLVLADVLIGSPEFDKVKTLTQVEDELFLAGLTIAPPIAYQPYANGIVVNYVTKELDAKSVDNSYKNPKNVFYFKPFLHGEVYALYIVLHLANGSISDAFHIPGREVAPLQRAWNTLGALENLTLDNTDPLMPYEFFEDSLLGQEVKYFQTRDTSANPQAGSNMSFWENQDETYEDTPSSDVLNSNGQVVNSFRNQKVRHHKFPSLRAHGVSPSYGTMRVLGIEVSNVLIPSHLQEQVVGYEIFYAKRGDNATVVGQSLATFASTGMKETEDTLLYDPKIASSTGGNWNYYFDEDATPDKYKMLHNEYIRMNPPDMLLGNKVQPTHITHEYLLGKTAHILNTVEIKSGESLLIDVQHLNDTQSEDVTGVYPVRDENYLYRISDPKVVFHNTDPSGTVENYGCESAFVARITSPTTDFLGLYSQYPDANPIPFINDFTVRDAEKDQAEADRDRRFFASAPRWQTHVDYNGSRWVHNYLTNLHVYRRNVYDTFQTQELVATGVKVLRTSSASGPVFGGDSFMGNYGVRQTAPNAVTFNTNSEYGNNPQAGIKVLYHYVVESTCNIALRHQDTTTAQTALETEYYPKSQEDNGKEFLNTPLNYSTKIGYNSDYSALNELTKTYPYDSKKYIASFPTRIHRSRIARREEQVSSWKNFPANDYYDLQRNRGVITALIALGNRLLIHTELSLFRTVNKLQLQTDTAKITLGSGDIFTQTPEELVFGSNGYAGTRLTSSGIVCKLGYFFVSDAGKVFLVGDGVQEISNKGMGLYFRSLLHNYTGNNPFDNNGFTAVWDEEYERILLINAGKGTLSYSADGNFWASRHDYAPGFITNSGDTLLSLNSGHIYQHNVGKPGVYYSTTYPMSVDVVLDPSNVSKLYQMITWESETEGAFSETFDKILVFNNRQSTGYLKVLHRKEGRMVEGSFYFNRLRDIVKDRSLPFMTEDLLAPEVITLNHNPNKASHNKPRFTGKYVIVRLHYSNNSGNSLSLHSVDVKTIPSNRL